MQFRPEARFGEDVHSKIWFLRRLLRISYMDRVTNDEVMRRAGVERELRATINKRRLSSLGHVIGKEGVEPIPLQGRIDGKRARGRQRMMTHMDNMEKVAGIESTATIFASARDRQRWRNTTAQACITSKKQASSQ